MEMHRECIVPQETAATETLGEEACAAPAAGEAASCSSVKAMLKYQADTVRTALVPDGRVFFERDENGVDKSHHGLVPAEREVQIQSARGRGHTLDQDGFQLVRRPLQRKIDFFNNQDILDNYYRPCEEIAKEVTGATKAVAFDHNVRSLKRKKNEERLEGGNQIQEPATYVHCDYTLLGLPKRMRELAKEPKLNDTRRQSLFSREEVERYLEGRVAILSVWRNISETPVQKHPLAVCQSGSVPLTDHVSVEIRNKDRCGESYALRYNAGHSWFYVPQITNEEVLLIKTGDTAGEAAVEAAKQVGVSTACGPNGETVPATWCFHCAFEDPTSPPDAPDRESIEVRVMLFFG